jgi:hypothetical protein
VRKFGLEERIHFICPAGFLMEINHRFVLLLKKKEKVIYIFLKETRKYSENISWPLKQAKMIWFDFLCKINTKHTYCLIKMDIS